MSWLHIERVYGSPVGKIETPLRSRSAGVFMCLIDS